MNKVYIGTKTFEIYGSINDERISEPLFECDELMAPTIQILNRLGFATQSCCSGHIYDFKHPKNSTPKWMESTCYIMFKDTFNDLEDKGFQIPKGFEVLDPADYLEPWDYDWGFIMQKEYDEKENKLFQILETVKDLYNWACSLEASLSKDLEGLKENRGSDFEVQQSRSDEPFFCLRWSYF